LDIHVNKIKKYNPVILHNNNNNTSMKKRNIKIEKKNIFRVCFEDSCRVRENRERAAG
jgi:hypothetical protein